VTSLLRLESSRAEHASVETVLGDMKWRVRAMALLHESLYRSDNFASIRLDSYIQQMATEVFRSGLDSDRRISLVLELSPVVVSMNQATPCGLIVNELISNVLKHGFPDGRIGMLKVELLSPDAQGQTRLRVSDNGIGLPADFEQRKAESLGMQMVVDLAMQLGGSLRIGPPPTAVFTLSFVAESAAPSDA
jgi:two-component sensor histidine kinase